MSGSGDPSAMASDRLPETMPAAVFMGLRDVAVEDRPTPEPGPDELLLEVSHCGICGSDLHFLVEWGGKSGAIEGHEFSGTVVALGADVTGWAVGDRVVGGPSPKCGKCEYCLAGRPSLCTERERVGGDDDDWQGAFAGYKRSAAAEALRVPDGLSLKHAALIEPLAVALHGITRRGGARPGTRWLVTGGGPIGFLSVAALKALGVDDIVVSEPQESRRALCEKLGARAVDPAELVDPGDAARPRRRTVRRRARVLGQRPRPGVGARAARSAAARSCSSARAWPGRSSTRTASCSTSS